MKHNKKILSLLSLAALASLPFTTIAETMAEQTFSLAGGISLQQEQTAVIATLEKHCQNVTRHENSGQRFPLAVNKEDIVVCQQYQQEEFNASTAAFVFADDKLVHAQLEGVDVEKVRPLLGNKVGDYLGQEGYHQGIMWLKVKPARFTWIVKDGLHPHLFAWVNPYLHSNAPAHRSEAISVETPELLAFSSKLSELERQFAKQCKMHNVRDIEKVWLPHKPAKQQQIDCIGIEYAGFERKVEAVFGDGTLELAWILTAKQEEDRIRKVLQKTYGEAILITKDYEVFAGGRVALRKDKPELLLLSKAMQPLYMAKFKKAAAQESAP